MHPSLYRRKIMAEKNLEGLRVAIIAADYFEQAELQRPKEALDDAGADTKIVSVKPGEIQGVNHVEKGDKFKVDMTLADARPDQFDAVLLPGGAVNADFLRVVPEAQRFVQEFDRAGKPIAFICHAPWLLVSARLAKDRTFTSYHTIQDDMRNAGAHWVDKEVVRDRNWVSSRQPSDIPAFNSQMITLFAEAVPSQRAA
jgi:protease I